MPKAPLCVRGGIACWLVTPKGTLHLDEMQRAGDKRPGIGMGCNSNMSAYVYQDIVTKMLHVDPHQRLTAPQVRKDITEYKYY